LQAEIQKSAQIQTGPGIYTDSHSENALFFLTRSSKDSIEIGEGSEMVCILDIFVCSNSNFASFNRRPELLDKHKKA